MARIELRHVSHAYPTGGQGWAVEDNNLVWDDGSANALLGPSGCGKTTTLSIISGLLVPTQGEVLIDGKDVTRQSPRERGIAQVFQFPVVYDSMTVAENLAFPLRNRGVNGTEAKRRVTEIAELLELTPLLGRPAGRISQAEKQKVSLGRGIVRRDTAAILLDEPLTVIDPKEKYGLRRKLREVQRELRITMIYVTHDQHEALTFADRVTVMDAGKVVQTGTPEELHSAPASPFVGFFIGSPGMNLLPCRYQDGRWDCGGFSVPAREELRGECRLGIRPEFVETSAAEWPDGVRWEVRGVEQRATHKILALGREGAQIKSRVAEDFSVSVGGVVWTRFPVERVKVFGNEAQTAGGVSC